MEQKLLTTIFDDEKNEEPQVIVYLKHNMRTNTSKVTRDILKYKITNKTCLFYLCMHYPYIIFTKEQVLKLNSIFTLLLQKANNYQIEGDTHNVMSIGYASGLTNFGESTSSKYEFNEQILFSPELTICNFDWDGDCTKKPCSLLSLLQDECKYKCFLDFWTCIIDHQQIRDCLKEYKLTDDVIDVIFIFMNPQKYTDKDYSSDGFDTDEYNELMLEEMNRW